MKHQFQPDHSAGPDVWDRYPCTCGLPERNDRHEVPERSDEEKAVEARRLGET